MLAIEKDPFDKGLYTFFTGSFSQGREIRQTFVTPFVRGAVVAHDDDDDDHYFTGM